MIDKETVERILNAADIVDVVSDFVHLRRRGSNYVGLCPFHNEKTPSFSVSRSKGICKCFSCGKGGSPVNFIMEHEQMSYYEALKYLARKYNIEVKERELTDEERQAQSERESMLIVNDFALKHFETNLFETDEGRDIGLSYFYERGFTDAIIRKFHLGYSLERSTDLYDAILREGLNPKFAIETGLCINTERGAYDRFKGRVMFPVMNIAGKVIAFGGRTLKKDLAKYVNSPESAIYKKKNELYGLYQAKQAIVKKEKCFLVEGYTDVLSMHQAGIENVVASSGTSLTEGQIRLIHRFSDNITVLYDGDAAGIKASLRGIDLLLAEGLNVKVLLLPDGNDPDSFAKKHSAAEFQGYIESHETDFIKFKISILLNGIEDDPIRKAEAISDIVKSIAVIPSEITRAVYIKECSASFDIDEKILAVEVRKAISGKIEKERANALRKKYEDDDAPTETGTEKNEEQKSAPEPAQPAKNPLKLSETEVIRYIAKYGMCDFCDAIDANGTKYKAVVLEYIYMDLNKDEMSFSVPAYQKIYQKALSLLPEFKTESEKKAVELEQTKKELEREEIERIRTQFDNIDDIRQAEDSMKERIGQRIETELAEFKTDFLERHLCSDPDEDIRKITLELVTEKAQLSKLHTKYAKIESDYDRLSELVPQSLLVWKDAILDLQIKHIRAKINDSANSPEDTENLMKQISELQQLRSRLAKHMGERVIIP